MADENDPIPQPGEVPQPTDEPAQAGEPSEAHGGVSDEDAEELRKKVAEHLLEQAQHAEHGEGPAVEHGGALTQEALARRVSALGEEDATEAIAREEEEKLAERRQAPRKKKGSKKGGKSALETAASKRLGKIGTKRGSASRALPDHRRMLDPLIDRTVALPPVGQGQCARRCSTASLAVAVLALAGGDRLDLRTRQKRDEAASTALAAAIGDEHGRIGDAEKEKEKEDDGPRRSASHL